MSVEISSKLRDVSGMPYTDVKCTMTDDKEYSVLRTRLKTVMLWSEDRDAVERGDEIG
jgi:hypothetical protein